MVLSESWKCISSFTLSNQHQLLVPCTDMPKSERFFSKITQNKAQVELFLLPFAHKQIAPSPGNTRSSA